MWGLQFRVDGSGIRFRVTASGSIRVDVGAAVEGLDV